jgi:amidase
MAVNMAATVSERLEELGRDLADDDLEPGVRRIVESGWSVSGEHYVRAVRTCHALGRAMAAFHEVHDLVLTPTLGLPPVPLGAMGPTAGSEAFVELVRRFASMTAIFNATGQPAMSVPLHWTDDGLPVGVQFAAPFGDEATLFRLAGQLERAAPWADRRPAPT